jgi:hypothetical protein
MENEDEATEKLIEKVKEKNIPKEAYEEDESLKDENVQGIWQVYDIEANGEIQKLLQGKKYAFRFFSSPQLMQKIRDKKSPDYYLSGLNEGKNEIVVMMLDELRELQNSITEIQNKLRRIRNQVH